MSKLTAEEFYEEYYNEFWQPKDHYEKVEKKFDYHDIIDFASSFAEKKVQEEKDLQEEIRSRVHMTRTIKKD